MSCPPQLYFSPDVRRMDEWAQRTGIPLTTVEALGTLYARAHRWLLHLKDQLVCDHRWTVLPHDPRMLLALEATPPPGFRSPAGLSRSPPMQLILPLHATTFFSPERRVQWEMVFHSALFPAMRHSVRPLADILHLLQCLLTGLIVLVKDDSAPGQPPSSITRGLPPEDWVAANESMLLDIFGLQHYRKLFKAASDKRIAFMLDPPPRT